MIHFIIPVYNEEKNIQALLFNICALMKSQTFSYRIVIVNDGSTDMTEMKIKEIKGALPIVLLSHSPNQGVGKTFRHGFSEVLSNAQDTDIVVTLEADGTSDLEILEPMIKKVQAGCDIVLASCYSAEGGVRGTKLFRVLLSKIANILLRFFFPLKNINTYSSFYRVFKVQRLRELDSLYREKLIEEQGFECMVELLVKFSRLPSIQISEVPMILDGEKRRGKSKMKVVKTITGFLKVILKYGILYRLQSAFPTFSRS